MIWDGDCHFCRLWIERWREKRPLAKSIMRLPAITGALFLKYRANNFQRSVVYIDNEGEVFFAAEAVYRSLRGQTFRNDGCRGLRSHSGLRRDFRDRLSALSRVRTLAQRLLDYFRETMCGRRLDYRTALVFLRALGLVYLIAFVSLWVQIVRTDPGPTEFLPSVAVFFPHPFHEQLGARTHSPCCPRCAGSSTRATSFSIFSAEAVLSSTLLLIFGIAWRFSLGLFVFLSFLASAGQTFLSFQWGHSAARNWFHYGDLFRATAAWPRRDRNTAGLTRRAFSAQAPSLQIDGDVRRGEADERRRLLVEPDRARYRKLLVATAADCVRVVGEINRELVQEILGRILSRRPEIIVPFLIWKPPPPNSCRGVDNLPASRDRVNG